MGEIIKKNLVTLFQGLMFGFGFSIAAWILYFLFQGNHHAETNQYEADSEQIYQESKQFYQQKETKFSFHNVEEVKRNEHSYFVGMVKNDSSSTASGINIEVNLFLGDKFVDQYSTYLSGSIKSGEERYFKISCGCKDNPPAEHDNYKIRAISGY